MRIIKYFFLTIVVSISIVWLSNYPGNVEIQWQEYLIQTNLVGLIVVVLIFTFSIILLLTFFRKIREFPYFFNINRKEKNLKLGNNSLDEIAINLVTNDSDNLDKNSRKVKRFLGNELFSTFMLFFSSLLKNNINEAEKYLKILERIPKADYIAKRSRVLLSLRDNNADNSQNILEEYCIKYTQDEWFSEKLASIFVIKKNWQKASDILEKIKFSQSTKIKNMRANIKILAGSNAPDAFKISNLSVNVVIETIKFYIDDSNLRKAANIVEKNWKNFFCFEIVENFIEYKRKNENDSLKRFKLISKTLKNSFKDSNESKLALAFAAYRASIWGEAQKIIDLIPRKEWDIRVLKLYEKLSNENSKIVLTNLPSDLKNQPLWICEACNMNSEKWEFVCKNCGGIDSFNWPKSKLIKNKKKDTDYVKALLKDSFSHFPKMK